MRIDDDVRLVPLAIDQPIWDRFFSVAPLVIVGTKEDNGGYNLAPKHLAMPLGWENYYCFVCSPRHTTYHNIRRHEIFTVSFPRPSDVLAASLAAAPRCEDLSKPSLLVLPTFPASKLDLVLVKGCTLFLECSLHSIVDGFGPNSLIIGTVVAAAAAEDALRAEERDEADQIYQNPLLAYVSPGRIAEIRQTHRVSFSQGLQSLTARVSTNKRYEWCGRARAATAPKPIKVDIESVTQPVHHHGGRTNQSHPGLSEIAAAGHGRAARTPGTGRVAVGQPNRRRLSHGGPDVRAQEERPVRAPTPALRRVACCTPEGTHDGSAAPTRCWWDTAIPSGP